MHAALTYTPPPPSTLPVLYSTVLTFLQVKGQGKPCRHACFTDLVLEARQRRETRNRRKKEGEPKREGEGVKKKSLFVPSEMGVWDPLVELFPPGTATAYDATTVEPMGGRQKTCC